MKRKFFRLISLILLIGMMMLFPAPVQASVGNWVIDGNAVYVDDDNVYLSAAPHTLGSSGWVEFTLVSKRYEGDIDAVWGFGPNAKASKPQVWVENMPHTKYRLVEVEKQGELTVTGITSFIRLDWATFPGEPNIGNRNNTYLYQVTGDFGDFIGVETKTIAFNTYVKNGTTATVSYNYTDVEQQAYVEYYPDWKPLNAQLSKVTLNYEGMSDWYYARFDTSILKDVTYKARVWVEIPFAGNGRISGKYVWGVKPSGETISQAKDAGHLYLIDPWYDSIWLSRKKLTFSNGTVSENLTNFPVAVQLTNASFNFTQAQALGQDIRFVDADDATLLDYEIENWTSGNSTLWVNVPKIDASSDTDFIYMYWGNATAADGQDVTGTWNANYVAVYHMYDNPDTSTVQDSTSNNLDGTKVGTGEPVEYNSKLYKEQDYDGSNDYISHGGTATFSLNNAYTVEFIANIDAIGANSFAGLTTKRSSIGDYPGATWMIGIENRTGQPGTPNGLYWSIENSPVHTQANVFTGETGKDLYMAYSWNGTTMKPYKNSSALNTNSKSAPLSGSNLAMLTGTYSTGAGYRFNGKLDEVRISNIGRSANWIKATYLSLTGSYITYGTTESIAPPTGLILTDLGAITVSANWTRLSGVTYTMLRMSRFAYPTSTTSGELAYYGPDESANITGVYLDGMTLYVSAWGFASDNIIYGATYATASIGGEGMEDIATALGSLTAAFTGTNSLISNIFSFVIVFGIASLAYWHRDRMLYILSGFAFLLYGFAFWTTAGYISILLVLAGIYCFYKAKQAKWMT